MAHRSKSFSFILQDSSVVWGRFDPKPESPCATCGEMPSKRDGTLTFHVDGQPDQTLTGDVAVGLYDHIEDMFTSLRRRY